MQEGVQPFGLQHECALTLSQNGLLAFQNGTNESLMTRVATDGSSREPLFPPDRYCNPRVSPDGKKIVFELPGSSQAHLIRVHDLERGSRTLISERSDNADSPAWSADGTSLIVFLDTGRHVPSIRVRSGWRQW